VLAARAGRRVLVIDADLGLANADIILGLDPARHLGHLLDGSAAVEELLARGPHGVCVLAASSGIQQLTRLGDAQKLALVSALDALEDRFDLVLVDCGPGIGDNVLFFAGAAQEALLVLSPEPTALADAYAAVKVLSVDAAVRHFQVVVNMVADAEGARDVFRMLSQVADRFLPVKLSLLGHVPRDESLRRALQARQPVVELFPRAPASRALHAVCGALLAAPPPAALGGGMKLLWSRLCREAQAG
jgi:flagellar biosynthesis protein FlhG